jgi:formate dehydrogenase major subunit
MPKNDTAPEIKLTINGKECTGREGQTILEVANNNDVYIPTLCYLKALSPVGACRMCIVEVEGMRKIVTSCTTPAANGMVVQSETEKLQKMRRMILELMFSERNHFCPFCELSGGDCELQNKAYENKMDHIRYPYLFPNLPVDSSHPYFVLDHNRCILCSRCIRYCDEVEGVHTLDLGFRGHNAMVVVDLNQSFDESSCTSCGGCVQACPTGALFNKLSAYRGKTKDCQMTKTVCQQCSLGCGIEVYTKGNHLVNIDGDEASSVNHGHLCKNGRFEPLLNHKARILRPAVVHQGASIEFSWDKALDHISYRLKRLKAKNPNSIHAYISPKMTNEAIFSFMHFFRNIIGTSNAYLFGSYQYNNFARALNKPNTEYSVLNMESDMSRLDDSDCIIVMGVDPGKTHKVLAARIRSRIRQQKAKLVIINDSKSQLDDMSDIHVTLKTGTDGVLLNSLISLELTSPSSKQQVELPYSLREEFNQYTPEYAEKITGIPWDKIVQISKMISRAKNPVFVFGRGLAKQNNPQLFQTLINFIRQVGRIENGKLPILGLRHGANARGAFEIDMMMRQEIGGAPEDFSVRLLEKVQPEEAKFLFLALGDDELPFLDNDIQKMNQMEFLVVQTSYPSDALNHAEVVLPSPVWYEKIGTMGNALGQNQVLKPVFEPQNQIPQEWEVFAELAKRFTGDGSALSLEKTQAKLQEMQAAYRSGFTPVNMDAIPFQCVSFPETEEGR